MLPFSAFLALKATLSAYHRDGGTRWEEVALTQAESFGPPVGAWPGRRGQEKAEEEERRPGKLRRRFRRVQLNGKSDPGSLDASLF